MILSHNMQNKNNKFLKLNIFAIFYNKAVSENATFTYIKSFETLTDIKLLIKIPSPGTFRNYLLIPHSYQFLLYKIQHLNLYTLRINNYYSRF
jgi:hypothetical protein